MPRGRTAAAAVVFVALVGTVGAIAFDAARDDPPRPPTPSTTTSTTTTVVDGDDLALAIAASLSDGLDVPLTGGEARCVADGMVAVLGQERLETLADSAGPDLEEQAALIRTVVGCVPPDKAAVLLSSNPSTTVVADLPGEAVEP